MKSFLLVVLFLVVIAGSVPAQALCENGQCYSATLNGSAFQFRDYWPTNALLYRQQESLDGRIPARTVISIILSGVSRTDSSGKQFHEGIQFEIMYEEGKLGEPAVYTVSMQHQWGLYSIIKGQGALTVTGFNWEPDHRSFRLSVDVNCVMHSFCSPVDPKNDIVLEAHISNVLITVPAWVAVSQK